MYSLPYEHNSGFRKKVLTLGEKEKEERERRRRRRRRRRRIHPKEYIYIFTLHSWQNILPSFHSWQEEEEEPIWTSRRRSPSPSPDISWKNMYRNLKSRMENLFPLKEEEEERKKERKKCQWFLFFPFASMMISIQFLGHHSLPQLMKKEQGMKEWKPAIISLFSVNCLQIRFYWISVSLFFCRSKDCILRVKEKKKKSRLMRAGQRFERRKRENNKQVIERGEQL